jgi:hypothetical protein
LYRYSEGLIERLCGRVPWRRMRVKQVEMYPHDAERQQRVPRPPARPATTRAGRALEPGDGRIEACPYCGSTEFHGRQRGGYCRNVECAHCGARFNLLLFRDYPVLLIDILAGPRSPEARRVRPRAQRKWSTALPSARRPGSPLSILCPVQGPTLRDYPGCGPGSGAAAYVYQIPRCDRLSEAVIPPDPTWMIGAFQPPVS